MIRDPVFHVVLTISVIVEPLVSCVILIIPDHLTKTAVLTVVITTLEVRKAAAVLHALNQRRLDLAVKIIVRQ